MKAYTRRELFTYMARVEPALLSLNHFEVLDVDKGARSEAIQRAFHDVASRAHPDRHRTHLSGMELERLTRVYARISEAYRVLKSDDLRQTYIRDLRGVGKLGVGKSSAMGHRRSRPHRPGGDAGGDAMLEPRAQRLYRRAEAALRTGDIPSAVLNLRMALARQPSSALLRRALKNAEAKR